ncbi:MAG: hypothetical protein KatS3mg059_0748 [Thermomicrobiales bacterium]|nr:MAG: hypothetical protein KatS3mg059_0748 [Thermomicrobiales bacterium]
MDQQTPQGSRRRPLRAEVTALGFALADPRTPWHVKALALCVVGYAVSPLDLIPDPIPILGLLDDVILLPFGVALVRRLIPAHVLEDALARVDAGERMVPPGGWIGTGIIVATWLILALLAIRITIHLLRL